MSAGTDVVQGGEGGEGGDAEEAREDKPRALWKELPILVVVAVGLALLIKTFFLQAFFIPSESMQHTLEVGDRVLVNKLVYDFRNPHRGEIVVFNGKFTDPVTGGTFPDESNMAPAPTNAVGRGIRSVTGFLGLGSGDDSDFIKRVIGIGGDTVSCPGSAKNPNVCEHVLVNGKAIDERAYLYETTLPTQAVFKPVTVPAGRLFVMGDHRDDSDDSRPQFTNATVPVDQVVGRAFVEVWPPSRFGGLPVPKSFNEPLTAAAGSAVTPPVAGLLLALPTVGLKRGLTRGLKRRLRRRRSRRSL